MSRLMQLKNRLLFYRNMLVSEDHVPVDYCGSNIEKSILTNDSDNYIFSKDAEFVSDKLNQMLNVISVMFDNSNGVTSLFFDDIIKWRDKIYVVKSKPVYSWEYTMKVVEDVKCHCIVLKDRKKEVLRVVVNTTLDNSIVNFNAKYLVNIPTYKIKLSSGDENKPYGTSVISINGFDNNVKAILTIYSMDLLDGNEYSINELASNVVEEIVTPVVLKKTESLHRNKKSM